MRKYETFPMTLSYEMMAIYNLRLASSPQKISSDHGDRIFLFLVTKLVSRLQETL